MEPSIKTNGPRTKPVDSAKISGYISGNSHRISISQSYSMPSKPSSNSRKTLQRHRQRLAERGLRRIEVLASGDDAVLVKSIAQALRETDHPALRQRLEQAMTEPSNLSFKELLESAPLDGIELPERLDVPRAVDL